MKRFIISISAIILLVFIGFIAVFYGGFYVDSGRDNHVNTFVRTENKEILIKDKDKWKPFEVRGIDMGSGIPGEWSTDYAITKETYLRWFQLIQEAGANTLRVYSVQNPSFYKAFYEYNSQHEEPLYLLQGIWVNDYIQNSRVDAYADSFAGKLLDNCLVTVDVIHGKRLIINNDADTSTGLYLHDVSKWVLGYIIGNGWEDTTVGNIRIWNRIKEPILLLQKMLLPLNPCLQKQVTGCCTMNQQDMMSSVCSPFPVEMQQIPLIILKRLQNISENVPGSTQNI